MFAGIVVCLMVLADFSFGTLSSMRAYVGGESIWSKAQKDAVLHLQKYAAGGAPEELYKFRTDMAIYLGDHEARIEMDKPSPDIGKVRRGFIRGGNHHDDVDGMFDLYRRFRQVSYMQKAVRAWSDADQHMALLEGAGTNIQRDTESCSPSPARFRAVLADVSTINDNLTPI